MKRTRKMEKKGKSKPSMGGKEEKEEEWKRSESWRSGESGWKENIAI